MKFSGKMCLKIRLKVTKDEGFTLSLENTYFKKPQASRFGVKQLTLSDFKKWSTTVLKRTLKYETIFGN